MNKVAVIDRVTIDCIYSNFKGFPKDGEEIITPDFSITLGGGACVMPIKLSKMGINVRFGTFLGDDELSSIARGLLNKFEIYDIHNFYHGNETPVVYSTVFSTEKDRGILSYDAGIGEDILTDDEIYNFLKSSEICFAPRRENIVKRLHNEGSVIVYDSHWEEAAEYIGLYSYFALC